VQGVAEAEKRLGGRRHQENAQGKRIVLPSLQGEEKREAFFSEDGWNLPREKGLSHRKRSEDLRRRREGRGEFKFIVGEKMEGGGQWNRGKKKPTAER